MLQVPQLLEAAARSPEIQAFFATYRPFFEDVARECAESPSFFPSAQATYTVPDDWAPYTLVNGWQPFGAAQFGSLSVRMSADGECELRGVVKRSTAPAAGSLMLPFPPGYEPTSDGDKRVLVEASGAPGAVEVLPPASGRPTGALAYLFGSTTLMDLSGVRYRARARTPPVWKKAPTFRFESKPGSEVTPELLIMQAETLEGNGKLLVDAFLCLPRWKLIQGGVSVVGCTGLRPGFTYRLTAWAITR